MKKIINILAIVAIAAAGLTGCCYDNYDVPAPAKVYSDSDFEDLEKVSIYELKSTYSKELEVGGSQVIEDDIYISGKVISTDIEGNVYKSLYILDHSGEKMAGIELKLFASNYVFYPVGTMVYVKLKGLTLGDYRCMLSVGAASTNPDYANNNIENRLMLDSHIFKGETLPMVAQDTIVVVKSKTPDNPNNDKNRIYYMDLTDDYLGCLVRFEDVESTWGASSWGNKSTFPSYFSSKEDFFDWDSSSCDWAPTLAHTSDKNVKYYGSSWYSYTPDSKTEEIRGNYVARVSSYSRFQGVLVPKAGQHLDITAIYTRFAFNRSNYSSESAFASSQSGAAYQLLINRASDIVLR